MPIEFIASQCTILIRNALEQLLQCEFVICSDDEENIVVVFA